jgi:hypothetical protein
MTTRRSTLPVVGSETRSSERRTMGSKRSSTSLASNIQDLRNSVAGEIALPGDRGWDAARQAWNLAVDQHPMAVAFPESAEDVATVIEAMT